MPDSSEPAPEATVRDLLYENETTRHLLFYSAIGRVVVLWGDVEAGFGILAMMLYQNGGDAHTPRPPYQFSEKIKFWRRCFDRLPELSAHRKMASKFADDMAAAAKQRDAMIHSNWNVALDHDANPTSLTLKGSSIVGKESGHRLMKAEMSLQALYKFTATISNLKFRSVSFTVIVAGLSGQRRWREIQQGPSDQP